MLYTAGEDIRAGARIVISPEDGKLYAAGGAVFGGYIGIAADNIRSGMRVYVDNYNASEDDA